MKKIGVTPEVLLMMNLANSADSATRSKRKKQGEKYFTIEVHLPPYETIIPCVPPAGYDKEAPTLADTDLEESDEDKLYKNPLYDVSMGQDEISATGPVLKVVPPGAVVAEVLPESNVVEVGTNVTTSCFGITWDNCALPCGRDLFFRDSSPSDRSLLITHYNSTSRAQRVSRSLFKETPKQQQLKSPPPSGRCEVAAAIRCASRCLFEVSLCAGRVLGHGGDDR